MKYRIQYDFCDVYTDEKGLTDTFIGTHDELVQHLKAMRANGCYNIDCSIEEDENGEAW